MATKTISLDLEAYERLSRERVHPRESFSKVVKRAYWEPSEATGAHLLAVLGKTGPVKDEVIEYWERAQAEDLPPDSPWTR